MALEMFTSNGFDATTVDDVAAAAGIGRRTLFRYYSSKNDIPWGAFDEQLDRMRATFAALPEGLPVMVGVRAAVLDFNHVERAELPWHRQRMRLILTTPALQAHSTFRYAEWRGVVAEFAAARLGLDAAQLLPRTIGHVSLGAALAAYEQWLSRDDLDLREQLDAAFALLVGGFATVA